MKPTLVPGLTQTQRFTVTEDKTVANLYPESPAFAAMPKVFATGFMVGFIEWACSKPQPDQTVRLFSRGTS